MTENGSSDFVVECSSCSEGRKTDELEEASIFAEKHQEHTGHDIVWIEADLGAEVDISMHERWEVICDSCGDKWSFTNEESAAEFYEEHEEYTDHAAKSIEQAEDDVVQIDDVKQMIEAYLDAGEFENGVPIPLLITEAERVGSSQSEVQNEIERLRRMGEVYEPLNGHPRTV